MDAILILGGSLLIVAGVMWLVALAYDTSLLWGIGALIPPLTLVYVYRHWNTAKKAVALVALGFIPLIVGFTFLASRDPDRISDIVRLTWLEPQDSLVGQGPALALRGELSGRPFRPETGSFINGVLSLREGDTLRSGREVKIKLDATPAGAVRVDVLPQDVNPGSEVELYWNHPEQGSP